MAKPKMHPESDSRKPLTADRLRNLLHYDPETGIFTWLRGPRVGQQAGHPDDRGYIVFSVDDANQYAHRLAWLYMTGEWPAGFIDHKDRSKSNNRFVNLRDSSNGQNQFNRGPSRANKSGIKGVFLASTGRWQSSIRASGRRYFLGCFDTKEEAATAYAEAAHRLHGEFSSVPPRREGG